MTGCLLIVGTNRRWWLRSPDSIGLSAFKSLDLLWHHKFFFVHTFLPMFYIDTSILCMYSVGSDIHWTCALLSVCPLRHSDDYWEEETWRWWLHLVSSYHLPGLSTRSSSQYFIFQYSLKCCIQYCIEYWNIQSIPYWVLILVVYLHHFFCIGTSLVSACNLYKNAL